VHTNKTLRRLAHMGFIHWHDRACEVLDPDGLMRTAGWHALIEAKRPLI